MIEERTQVLDNERVAQATFLMKLDSPGIAAEARAGQFVMLRVREGVDPLLRRPFSIAGVSGEQVSILYRVVGKGTQLMSQIRKEARLSVLGPLGTGFVPPSPGETAVLVSGGIGVAPLLFLAQALTDRPVRFLTGYRTFAEQVPLEEFDLPAMDTVLATDDGTAGTRGTVTDLLLDFWTRCSKGDSHTVFTCGPLPMLKVVAAFCLKRKIPCQVSFEATMACGIGACQGCVVKAAEKENRSYFHVCQNGPVFPAQALDWKSL
jgi:dihydroorotate dehydrogenase electron transfer subunit